ncbi:MAG: hypothetical protein ACLP0B_18650 [Steroidobacteraceae bacterium]
MRPTEHGEKPRARPAPLRLDQIIDTDHTLVKLAGRNRGDELGSRRRTMGGGLIAAKYIRPLWRWGNH